MGRCPNRAPTTINAIRELDGAVDAHAKWLARLHRALICGTEIDPNVLDPEGHRDCLFGRWFYSRKDAEWLRWEDELQLIGTRHEIIHQAARTLIAQRTDTCEVSAAAFDEFSEQVLQFKIAVRALQFKVINEVCLVDHLTGVWNRSSMYLRLAEEHERMTRQHQTCYLCMVDVDHFKSVNDRLGHAAGDEVLQAIADIIKERLRSYDSIFRYGGEEFLICLPNTALDAAEAAMERIRIDIEAADIVSGDQHISVTASFGLAPLSENLALEESVEVADRALFCAKAHGRNRVCRWDDY